MAQKFTMIISSLAGPQDVTKMRGRKTYFTPSMHTRFVYVGTYLVIL